MLLSSRADGTTGSWSRFSLTPSKPPKKDWAPEPPNLLSNPGMMIKQRYLTLACGEMETVLLLPPTFAEAEALARDWLQPPPDAKFSLRIPVEYASLQAARLVHGPYLWVANEETYQIAINGTHGIRLEIVTDAPPPEEEEPLPPLPAITEMPASFNLELAPGQMVGLDTTLTSDDLDMSRTENGTLVDGRFWGCLKITHDHEREDHNLEFTGTRLECDQRGRALPPDFWFDSRVMSKLIDVAAKPTIAKSQLSIYSPEKQYAELTISLSPMWKLGLTLPRAEVLSENRVKYFLRCNPGGALEHFDSSMVVTSLYYEAMPDTSQMEPSGYIVPHNGFAMPTEEFVPHLVRLLDSFGMSLLARTNFIGNLYSSLAPHKYVAYRFMSPSRLSAAIELSITADPVVWTRMFLMWRPVFDDEMGSFVGAGEKEASERDWKSVVGFNEESKNPAAFRVLEMTVMECS